MTPCLIHGVENRLTCTVDKCNTTFQFIYFASHKTVTGFSRKQKKVTSLYQYFCTTKAYLSRWGWQQSLLSTSRARDLCHNGFSGSRNFTSNDRKISHSVIYKVNVYVNHNMLHVLYHNVLIIMRFRQCWLSIMSLQYRDILYLSDCLMTLENQQLVNYLWAIKK